MKSRSYGDPLAVSQFALDCMTDEEQSRWFRDVVAAERDRCDDDEDQPLLEGWSA